MEVHPVERYPAGSVFHQSPINPFSSQSPISSFGLKLQKANLTLGDQQIRPPRTILRRPSFGLRLHVLRGFGLRPGVGPLPSVKGEAI